MHVALKTAVAIAVIVFGTGLPPAASAAEQELPKIVVGVLSYGTAQWEMKVIQDHDLDEKHGVELVLHDLGSEQAGDVALQSGDVDIVLTDFIWVSIQRNQGNMVTLVPHSKAVGGVIVGPDADIGSVEDLTGKTVGIAGGPVDKSWIILQAYYAQDHDTPLAGQVDARFAQPPLVNELLANGRIDAALNYWHYNARSKAAGLKELISVTDMLAELGISQQPPLLGWAFKNETASAKPEAVKGFLDASFEAKEMLLNDDEVWESLRPLMEAEDDAMFDELRKDYRAGIVTGYSRPDTVEAASQVFDIMAEYGGSQLVGDVHELADGTFWADYRHQ